MARPAGSVARGAGGVARRAGGVSGGGAFGRLLHLGNVVIDLVLDIPALPERGGDVLASRTELTPGGGFNVLAAAARLGLRAGYAGGHGTGPLADLARAGLAAEGIEVLQPPKAGLDTGFVVSMVDAAGERTFVTSPGAEATLTTADLARVVAGPADAVYLSGYGLVHPANRAALLGWLARLGRGNVVFFDPGPLLRSIPPDALATAAHRADWVTLNAREAALLGGHSSAAAALRTLTERPALARPPGPGSAGTHRRKRLHAGTFQNAANSGSRIPGHRARQQWGGRYSYRRVHCRTGRRRGCGSGRAAGECRRRAVRHQTRPGDRAH